MVFILKFEDKEFDGPYEICGIEIDIKGELLKGLVYYPPESFKPPYPLIIYFHGFPFTVNLQDIARNYKHLLDMGSAIIVFNFRGYGYSDGIISLESQLVDANKIIQFVKEMAKDNIFDLNNINILAHDFGAYIALLLCSKIKIINKLLLLTPILDVKRHVNDEEFKKILYYMNRFYPGYMRGLSDVDHFVEITKKELTNDKFQIEKAVRKLKNKRIKIIIGEKDKITLLSELEVFQITPVPPEKLLIDGMDHEIMNDEDLDRINEEIKKFFIS